VVIRAAVTEKEKREEKEEQRGEKGIQKQDADADAEYIPYLST